MNATDTAAVESDGGDQPDITFLTISDVEREVTLKKSNIFAMIQAGTFPAGLTLGKKSRRWVLEDILHWKRERIAAARSGGE